MFRQYKVFCSNLYKLFIWIIYPVCAMFGCFVIQTGAFGILPKGFTFHASITMLCAGIILVEVVSDYFIFAGIQSKTSNSLEFLKCSLKGKGIMRNTMIMDEVRRILVIFLVNLFNILLGVKGLHQEFNATSDMEEVLLYILIAYFFSILAIVICRFFTVIWANAITGYILCTFCTINNYIISHSPLSLTAWIMIYGVANMILSVLTVQLTLKKLMEGYHD